MRRFLLYTLVFVLTACSGAITQVTPNKAVPPLTPATVPLPTTLSAPSAEWSLTGSVSLYTRLYASSSDALNFDTLFPDSIDESEFDADNELNTHLIADRIITAVAADMVTQFFSEGTDPIFASGSDLVIWRTKDLLPIPQAQLALGNDEHGEPFLFREVQLWVRDSLFLAPDVVCKKWGPWWSSHTKHPIRLKNLDILSLCIDHVVRTRRAVKAERELQALRQDLSLIAYGMEFVWDGQMEGGDTELRTYDLLLDIAGVGNLLGSGPFDLLFNHNNQGEQCDGPLCTSCLLPAIGLCGDGGVQGAEQCDDGNRDAGDGCDEFCQVEHNYCGNGKQEPWEFCDAEGSTLNAVVSGNECPDGLPCLDYLDCTVGGETCGGDAETCASVWGKTCKYSGSSCNVDNDCMTSCPYAALAVCKNWVKDSCRFAADGVCAIGNILEGSLCRGQSDCSGISSCVNGYCSNHPSLRCNENSPNPDLACYTCRLEEITGTCYATGDSCNGNEDCSISGYCILEPEGICRPRTLGGRASVERSTCNEYCEDITRCGDRVVYLTEFGDIEQCDDGMHCQDGTRCVQGIVCDDGSACIPRDGVSGSMRSCTDDCMMQICGDGTPQDPEQCDEGATCFEGTPCSLNDIHACEDKGICRNADGAVIICNPLTTTFCADINELNDNPCQYTRDNVCAARSDDGDACDQFCIREYCGDRVTQKSLGEQCDDGGICSGNGERCSGNNDCPNYAYCLGRPDRSCDSDFDCPINSRCVSSGGGFCDAQSGDGCDALCQRESLCGNSFVDPGEQCDDGNTEDDDGCSSLCVNECGNGIIDSGEECDPGSLCVGGLQNGSDCTDDASVCTGGACLVDSSDQSCTSECTGRCGNSITDAGEQCDPGSRCSGGTRDGDNCSLDASVCTGGTCLIDTIHPSCTDTCQSIECGDCRVDFPQEQCEDGNTEDGDGCSACIVEYCGDGRENNGEECEYTEGENDDVTPICCDSDPNLICCSKNAIAAGTCVPTCRGGSGLGCILPAGVCQLGCTEADGLCPIIPPACPRSSPLCGDGCFDSGEICDDGNIASGDGCSASCTIEFCGDGITNNKTEECDPGSICSTGPNIGSPCAGSGSCGSSGATIFTCSLVIDDPACSRNCQLIVCGDCRVDAEQEQCEDGNTEPNDGCNNCRDEYCGDAVLQIGPLVQPLEECDDGGKCWDTNTCGTRDECPEPPDPRFKGIKPLCVAEPCDTCNNECQKVECGNGRKECKEECDDGNNADNDGCTAGCLWEFCGDGVIQSYLEEVCDNGFGNNDTEPGACRTNCLPAWCGDSVVDAGEECDVPTCPSGEPCKAHNDCSDNERCLPRDGQGLCSASCMLEGCGDGIVQSQYGEKCDDNNTVSGDGCSSSCQWEETYCGNGSVDAQFGEECDPADLNSGICAQAGLACSCEDGTTDCAPAEASCALGTCNFITNTCTHGGQVCTSNADCLQPCVNTCTDTCRNKALACGDGYRDPLEQCDDANRINGDGCSFTCQVERLDLCGNGIVDTTYGEECDQGHPYFSVECTPFCRTPHPAPMCGDGRKDPSGKQRGDLLENLLTFADGYQLDWRVPDIDQVLRTGTGGWYVTPRVFDQRSASPFMSNLEGDLYNEQPNVLGHGTCSECGNGMLDGTEQCDSGRLSEGSYANSRVNHPAWIRWAWSAGFTKFGTAHYLNWYKNLNAFGNNSYQSLTQNWQWQDWDRGAYIGYVWSLGGSSWQYADAAWQLYQENKFIEHRVYVQDSCSSTCRLMRCGNDRIEDGESCDDTNKDEYGRPQNGDGCSSECFQEDGFDFNAPGNCGDDILSADEQCDTGGQCVRLDGKSTKKYCRFETGRTFCLAQGVDGLTGSPKLDADNETCLVVEGDGCDLHCQIESVNTCGNAVLEPYEACDNGGTCTGDARTHCSSDDDCVLAGGTCEPVDGDGCSVDCVYEPAECGDGVLNPLGADGLIGTSDDEQCDPGKQCVGGTNNGTRCTGDPSVCNGGTCTLGGNANCSATCQRTGGVCGDGKAEKGEQCDAGSANNDNEPNACRTNCLHAFCGDAVIDRHEECDDGNVTPFDGCTECMVDLCGNGRIDVGETCDDGNRNPGDGCSLWCLKENICGNAILEGGETCDDGNAFSHDGCSAQCQREYCGDAIEQSGLGEECDDGNNNNEDACRNDCQLPTCGDNILDDSLLPNGLYYKEVCDPGKHCKNNPSVLCTDDFQCPIGPCDTNAGVCMGDATKRCTEDVHCGYTACLVLDTPTCAADCTLQPVCGDNKVNGHEECDPTGPGCDTLCHLTDPTRCGNGKKDDGEECDDGNRANHDGCTETCQFETFMCPGSCFLPFSCTDTGEVCQLQTADVDCPRGQCVMRSECVVSCVFGDCGDGEVDLGEQCDDGRRCSQNPDQPCSTHFECGGEGLCIPTSGDGCSSDCRLELLPPKQEARLLLCQEEIGGAYGQRIGSGQTAIWKDTLLSPEENPFVETNHIGTVRFLGTRGGAWWTTSWEWWDTQSLLTFSQERWPWYWGSGWWRSSWYAGWSGWYGWWSQWHTQCIPGAFPNSIGNLIQSSAGCLQATAHSRTMPNRTRISPWEPTGISSYGACQEPRAQLVSAVEIPQVPAIILPPYRPAELVRDIERYICAKNGFPRRFLFLCREVENLSAPFPEKGLAGYLQIHPLSRQQRSTAEEIFLSHALDIGYRSGESTLSHYLNEAFTALTSMVDTAVQLFGELQRIEFTDQVCPIDDTSLCSPSP